MLEDGREVGGEFVVRGDGEGETVLLLLLEGIGRVDAALVQDAVFFLVWGGGGGGGGGGGEWFREGRGNDDEQGRRATKKNKKRCENAIYSPSRREQFASITSFKPLFASKILAATPPSEKRSKLNPATRPIKASSCSIRN